jgi:hypothetical protein
MKKLLFLSLLSMLITSGVAQTTPRFGITKNNDNTGRVLTYALITTTDVTSATLDTIVLRPNAWHTIVRPSANIADSVCYKFASTSMTYSLGDVCTFMVSKGTGAGKIKFGGSVIILSTASAAVALAANKSAILRFRWTGTKWIEETRMVQP